MQIIKTLLSPARVCDRLAGCDRFEGEIETSHFKLREKAVLAHRLYFPFIEGDICENGEGSDVILRFKLYRASIIGFAVWLTIALLIGIVLSIYESNILPFTFVCVAVQICAGIFILDYWRNRYRASRRIERLLEP